MGLKTYNRIKQLPADRKIAALTGRESGMTISKKDLQALNKDVKALGNKIDKLLAAAGKKAKTTIRVPAKKTPTKKRPAKLTATDKVLRIIKGSKKGVDGPTLAKKTGFNEKKVWNILHRVYKNGKVKRAG
jgi:hypothetical protein